MERKCKVEVFSAGCPVCKDTIDMVERVSSQDYDINVLDMNDPAVAKRAKGLGIRSVPAIVIDGDLAECCSERGPDEASLKTAGLG